MNPQILTLFGEEYAAQPVKPAVKPRVRAKKKVTEVKETAQQEPKPIKKKKATVVHANILDGWQPDKQYYAIGEVASLFKVNTSHIRFWTKEFTIKVRTTKKGDRLYTPEQILEIRAIYHLVKERGFTLAGAKIKLREEKKNVTDTINLKQSLTKLRKQLQSIRNQLG